jgi:hypothetical protein
MRPRHRCVDDGPACGLAAIMKLAGRRAGAARGVATATS